MRAQNLLLALIIGAQAGRRNKKKKSKAQKISSRRDSYETKLPSCRFGPFATPSKLSFGAFVEKDPAPASCWTVDTNCDHGIEIKFTAKGFNEVCMDTARPKFAVYVQYDDGLLTREINLCSDKPTPEYVTYGDWIYLNGTSTILAAYKTLESMRPSNRYQNQMKMPFSNPFKLEWQCFTTDSSTWRRAIGNGWANVIKEEADMQERFKIKLHKIITKLMIQVTMKDKCLSEPNGDTLKRIEQAGEIGKWVKGIITLIRQRFATCKMNVVEDRELTDQRVIRHLQFKQAQAKNLQSKARMVIEKFQKFSGAPSQSMMEARFTRRAVRARKLLVAQAGDKNRDD